MPFIGRTTFRASPQLQRKILRDNADSCLRSVADSGERPLTHVPVGGVILSIIGTTASRALFSRLTDGQFRPRHEDIGDGMRVVYLTQGIMALGR